VAAATILGRARSAVLTGFQLWRPMTVAGLSVGAGSTIIVIAVLAAGGGINGIFAVEAGAATALLVWFGLLSRRALRSLADASTDGAPVRRMLRYTGLATIGVVLTLVIWRRSEFLFLDYYSTDAEIGFYSIAFAAATAVLLVPMAVTGVLLPSIATLHGAEERERVQSGYSRAGRLLLIMSFPLIAGAMALGPELIELVYGQGYHDAGTLLVILLLPAPLMVIGNLSTVVLAATERLLFPIVVGCFAAALNIALDFALIPSHDATGAAIANASAQALASVPVIVYVARKLGRSDWQLHSLLKAASAAGAGGLLAWGCVTMLGGVAGVLAGIAAGSAVFLVLARMLRMLSADDVHWLDRSMGSALGGAVGRAVRFCGDAPSRAA
jgi:O-antigen/teichoic acid export membrane protein